MCAVSLCQCKSNIFTKTLRMTQSAVDKCKQHFQLLSSSNNLFKTSVHPSHRLTLIFLNHSDRGAIGQKAGYTLDKSPVCHRHNMEKKNSHLHSHSHIESPFNLTSKSLDCGRKHVWSEPLQVGGFKPRTCTTLSPTSKMWNLHHSQILHISVTSQMSACSSHQHCWMFHYVKNSAGVKEAATSDSARHCLDPVFS